jgi:hypothetical protein
MARLTVFLARLIGLFTILLVPTLLVHGSAIIENTAADKPVMLTYGIISLAIGVAMIPGHNIWSGGALPLVVTLVGVVDPSEGSADLANRAGDISRSFEQLRYGEHYYFYLAPSLVIGLYLTWAGFTAKSA